MAKCRQLHTDKTFLRLKCLSLCCLWHLSSTKPLNFPPIFKLPSTRAFCYRHRHGWNALIHPSRRDVYRKPARFCQSKAHASTWKATLPQPSSAVSILCPVYTAALSFWHHHFPFDKSNFTRQTQHFSWPQIQRNSLRDCSIGREAFRLPPPDICHEGQITLARWGTMEKKKWTMRSLEDFIWYNYDNRTWKWMHCSQSLSFSK